jgi:hypothetical protein
MDRITIYPDEEICNVCGEKTPARKRYYLNDYLKDNFPSMKEVDIVVGHSGCRSLIAKRDKLKKELTDVEFRIFLKRCN